MIKAQCHCGDVRLTLPRAPLTLNACNCSICVRLGSLWAYYDPKAVTVEAAPDALEAYVRHDPPPDVAEWRPVLAFMRCRRCGCVTHWQGLEAPAARMGVNARMAPEAVWRAAKIRPFDGARTWRYLDESED